MQGKQDVIDSLNKVLTHQLTVINQFFLHSRMLNNWGFKKLGKASYNTSISEMKYADKIIERILFLEGLPNLQKLGKLRVGQNVEEIIDADMISQKYVVPLLKEQIKLCEENADYVSRALLESFLNEEEEYLDWLETQKELVEEVGIENYMQSQVEN